MAAKRDQDIFWEAVDRGELVAQKCAGCGKLQHPPRPRCPDCGSWTWETQRLSGAGRILSWVVLSHPNAHPQERRVGIVVDLDEGVRIASNLIDTENARTDAPVQVEFAEVGGARLALFRTVQA